MKKQFFWEWLVVLSFLFISFFLISYLLYNWLQYNLDYVQEEIRNINGSWVLK